MKREDVTDRQIKNIIDRIVEEIVPEQIILFGSRATGKQALDSDIDLLVIYQGDLSKREVKLKIRHLFSAPDFSLDLFVLTREEFDLQNNVNSTLGWIASQEGIVCYG